MSRILKNLTVLLVENNSDSKKIIYDILIDNFEKVITAQNGDEGLKKFYSRVDEIKKVRETRYQKFEKELKEKLMKELSLKDELNKEDLRRILNNLDLKKI